jgi:hypothetical protein
MRPTVVDYLLLLAGASLSLYLIEVWPLQARAVEGALGTLPGWVEFLPRPLRVSEGIVLLWPLFWVGQKLRRRREPLTAAEWLWALSWVGVALLSGVAVWHSAGPLPEIVTEWVGLGRRLWYALVVPSMAALAVVLGLAGLLRRGPAPWTHALAVALVLWPVVPLAGILALGRFL